MIFICSQVYAYTTNSGRTAGDSDLCYTKYSCRASSQLLTAKSSKTCFRSEVLHAIEPQRDEGSRYLPVGPSLTLEEKKGSSDTTLDSTKVYSSTSGSPLRPRMHASAKRAPAYAMDSVAEPYTTRLKV